jgi:hypothetical protein
MHQRYSDKESPIRPPSSPSMRWFLKFFVTTSKITDSLNLSVLNKILQYIQMLIVFHFTVWKDDVGNIWILMWKAPWSYICYLKNICHLIDMKLTTGAEQQGKQESSLLCHQVRNTFILDIAWFINSFHYNLILIGDDEYVALRICFHQYWTS